jgi:O-antigen/teichoic acid export membrane protein
MSRLLERLRFRIRIPALGPDLLITLGRSLGFAVTFLIPVVLARTFDQAAFGTYKQLFLIYTTLYYVAQLGMSESLFYFVPGQGDRAPRFVANALLCLGATGTLLASVVAAQAHRIAVWMGNPALEEGLPWLVLFLLLMLVASGFEMVLMARSRYRAAATAYVVSDLVKAAAFLAPAFLSGRLLWVLWGAIAFAVARLFLTVIFLTREFHGGLRPDAALFRRQIAYTLPFAAAVAVEIVQANLHQYFVSSQVTPAVFAVYSVGCLSIPIVDLVAGPAGNVMMVRMSEQAAEGNRQALLPLFHDTVRRLSLVFVPLCAFLAVASRDLIEALFTSRYAASVPIFAVWSLSILLASLPTDSVLRVHAQTPFIFLVNVLRLSVILGSILVLFRAFGLIGAVFATLLGQATARGAMLWRIARLFEVGPVRLLPWGGLLQAAVLAAGACLPALLLRLFLGGPALLRLIAEGTAFSIAGIAILFFMTTSRRPAAAVGEAPESCAVSQAS